MRKDLDTSVKWWESTLEFLQDGWVHLCPWLWCLIQIQSNLSSKPRVIYLFVPMTTILQIKLCGDWQGIVCLFFSVYPNTNSHCLSHHCHDLAWIFFFSESLYGRLHSITVSTCHNTVKVGCPGFSFCFGHAVLFLHVVSVYRASRLPWYSLSC